MGLVRCSFDICSTFNTPTVSIDPLITSCAGKLPPASNVGRTRDCAAEDGRRFEDRSQGTECMGKAQKGVICGLSRICLYIGGILCGTLKRVASRAVCDRVLLMDGALAPNQAPYENTLTSEATESCRGRVWGTDSLKVARNRCRTLTCTACTAHP